MKRIQRKRTKGWRMPPNTVYVGRPSKWGNPYVVTLPGDLETCLERYSNWLSERIADDPNFLDPLMGKDLACWCPLDRPCHADILLSRIEWLKAAKP